MQMEDSKVCSNDYKSKVAKLYAAGHTNDKKIDSMLETYKAGYIQKIEPAERAIPDALKPYINQNNK